MENIHATAVDIKGSGVLIIGHSGAGKSDLALRLIENKGAVLVSDDRVDLKAENDRLIATAPKTIEGLLEVRGIGIIKTAFKPSSTIELVVAAAPAEEIQRHPQDCFFKNQNVRVPSVLLDLFEPSAPDKIVVKLKAVLERKKETLYDGAASLKIKAEK